MVKLWAGFLHVGSHAFRPPAHQPIDLSISSPWVQERISAPFADHGKTARRLEAQFSAEDRSVS